MFWYNYAVPKVGNVFQKKERKRWFVEAVVHITHTGSTMGRSPKARVGSVVRQRLVRWMTAHPRSDVLIEIKQRDRVTMVQVRPIERAVVKSRAKAKLNSLQVHEMHQFVEALGREFGLNFDRNAFSCAHGYAWVIFTLTIPIQ